MPELIKQEKKRKEKPHAQWHTQNPATDFSTGHFTRDGFMQDFSQHQTLQTKQKVHLPTLTTTNAVNNLQTHRIDFDHQLVRVQRVQLYM